MLIWLLVGRVAAEEGVDAPQAGAEAPAPTEGAEEPTPSTGTASPGAGPAAGTPPPGVEDPEVGPPPPEGPAPPPEGVGPRPSLVSQVAPPSLLVIADVQAPGGFRVVEVGGEALRGLELASRLRDADTERRIHGAAALRGVGIIGGFATSGALALAATAFFVKAPRSPVRPHRPDPADFDELSAWEAADSRWSTRIRDADAHDEGVGNAAWCLGAGALSAGVAVSFALGPNPERNPGHAYTLEEAARRVDAYNEELRRVWGEPSPLEPGP